MNEYNWLAESPFFIDPFPLVCLMMKAGKVLSCLELFVTNYEATLAESGLEMIVCTFNRVYPPLARINS